MEKLALLGGKPVIEGNIDKDIFRWPIITEEDDKAAQITNAFAGAFNTSTN